jgi:hypothetical protein
MSSLVELKPDSICLSNTKCVKSYKHIKGSSNYVEEDDLSIYIKFFTNGNRKKSYWSEKDDPLWNSQIENVISMFSKDFNNFEHYDTYIVYKDLINIFETRLIKLILNALIKFKKYVLFINNGTEGNGIHWILIVIDIKQETNDIMFKYFNSLGDSRLPEVDLALAMLHVSIKKTDNLKDFNIIWKSSLTIHQIENNECGVYIIYFLYLTLLGIPFCKIQSFLLRDDEVSKIRNMVFLKDVEIVK